MPLTLLSFLGSVRDSTLAAVGHDAVLIDPLDFVLSGPVKPHIAYAQGKAPEAFHDARDARRHLRAGALT